MLNIMSRRKNMKNLSLSNIAKAVEGELHNAKEGFDPEITGAVVDSRLVTEGGLFIATKGERVDGHDYIEAAASKGAVCAIVEKSVECRIPYILVQDSFEALKKLAAFYREGLDIPIIGITGSVGKTSTKEFIAATLSAKYNVLKTQGNFNNEVGMPLTLLSIRDEHEIAVIEMGISDFGEMSRLALIAKPDTCVITNIGQCHLENLNDRDGVLRAKTEIFQFMNHEGSVYLNGDDDKLRTVKAPWNCSLTYFGRGENNHVTAKNVETHGLHGSDIIIKISDESCEIENKVHVPLPGEHMITDSLVAAAIAKEYGLTDEEIGTGIESVRALKGRSNIIDTESYTLIDDCYNANPVSMKAAIDLLISAETETVAILGDMFELGENTVALHRSVGEYAAEAGVGTVIAVGDLAQSIYEGVKSNSSGTKAYYFKTKDEAISNLCDILQKGDSVLVKASHGMHFEEVIEFLKDK